MQELAVDVRDRPVQVGLHHVEQPYEHPHGRAVAAVAGIQRHVDLRGDPAGDEPGSANRLVDQRLVGGAEAELSLEPLGDPFEVAVIAAHRRESEPRPQRPVQAA